MQNVALRRDGYRCPAVQLRRLLHWLWSDDYGVPAVSGMALVAMRGYGRKEFAGEPQHRTRARRIADRWRSGVAQVFSIGPAIFSALLALLLGLSALRGPARS